MTTFNKLYEIFKDAGFEDELDMNFQARPRPNKISAWTCDDSSGGAIILGMNDINLINFIFDKDLKLNEVRISQRYGIHLTQRR